MDQNILVAVYYSILTVLFLGYTVFNFVQCCRFHDLGSMYLGIIFGSLTLTTFCVAMVRFDIIFGWWGQEWWFYFQRSSYIGVLLGGWWLIDYRLIPYNGRGIPIRNLWRFWRLFMRGETG